MYAEAKEHFADGSYDKAIKSYEALQARYPYGRYAQQAQMEIAYTYFKQREADSALAAVDRFIKQYPNNAHVDYAYYLKGLINFNEDLGMLGKVVKQDLSERDPAAAQSAFEAFKELSTRFPNSQYTPDAKLRMQYLVSALARYEVHVADYYLRRGAYVAALNRAKDIIAAYPQTPATRDALRIMVRAYDALDMQDLRNDTQRVLDKNSDGITVSATPFKDEAPWWQFWK